MNIMNKSKTLLLLSFTLVALIFASVVFARTEVKNIAAIVFAAAPQPLPVEGLLYFDNSTKRLTYYDGSIWISIDPAHRFAGLTSAKYNGLFNDSDMSDGVGGIILANQICDANFKGSRICNEKELYQIYTTQVPNSPAWIMGENYPNNYTDYSCNYTLQTLFTTSINTYTLAGDMEVIDSNTIYLAYPRGSNYYQSFIKSTDGGNTWTIIDIELVNSKDSQIEVADANTVYVSYKDETNDIVKFAKSTDGGNTWTITSIDSNIKATGEIYLSMDFIAPSYIFLSYRDINNNLKFAKSTDGGNTWTTTVVDSASAVPDKTFIQAIDANTIFISYVSYEGGLYNLKFAKSTDGGNTWTITSIDSGGGNFMQTLYAIDSNNIYIAYGTAGSIKFAKSTDGGNTWTITNARLKTGIAKDSSLIIQNNKLYLGYLGFSNYDGSGTFIIANTTTSTLNVWTITPLNFSTGLSRIVLKIPPDNSSLLYVHVDGAGNNAIPNKFAKLYLKHRVAYKSKYLVNTSFLSTAVTECSTVMPIACCY